MRSYHETRAVAYSPIIFIPPSTNTKRSMAPSKMSFVITLLVALAAATPSAAFSFPPILPCIPGLPQIPFFPCVEPPPPKQVTECLTPLMKMVPPCTAFLTGDASVTEAPAECCEGFMDVSHMGAAICYCHVANGDIGRLLPAPMNFTRMFSLSDVCGSPIDLQALAKNCAGFGDVPPMPLPPSPPAAGKASPPPS